MKKLISLFIAGVLIVALSGCGGSSSSTVAEETITDEGRIPGTTHYYYVDISSLKQGYIIKWNEGAGWESLTFCNENRFIYTGIDFLQYKGTFNISDNTIEMHDDEGDNYTLNTDNHLLERGENYYINGLDSNIKIWEIRRISCS